MITSRAAYNLVEGYLYGYTVKREIPIELIEGLIISNINDKFIFYIPSERDYLFNYCEYRKEIIKTIVYANLEWHK